MSRKSTGNIVISALSVKPKSVVVGFSNGEKLDLSYNAYSDLRLYEGKEIGEKEYALIVKLSQEDRFYSYAISLLSCGQYTTYEVRGKLLGKGASKEMAFSIADRLTKDGLLNDRDYALNYVEDIGNPRLDGKRKIVEKLKEKGISAEILSVLDFPEGKEKEKALRYCETLNRRLAKVPTSKKREKAFGALLEKGFDGHVAKEAVEEGIEKTEYEDELSCLRKDLAAARRKFRMTEDTYARERKVYAALARKGYNHESIKAVMEESEDED